MKIFNIDFTVSLALAKREFIKYVRNRSRLITSLFQSLIFVGIFGAGLGNISKVAAGMIPQAILFTGIFAGISIVMDRMFGFLKEIMIAPISRTTISMGKALGGTLVASVQGIIVLIVTTALGIYGYDIYLIVKILAILPIIFLIAFLTTSLGNLIASRLTDMNQMQLLMTFLVMPMFFTSGALIDFRGTPFFSITLINPITYAVDAMQQILVTPTLFNFLFPTKYLPLVVDIFILLGFSLVFLILSAYIFRKSEAV
ncbi:MAG: ABC transporter permease [Candidatus Helarchaeota archaeon]